MPPLIKNITNRHYCSDNNYLKLACNTALVLLTLCCLYLLSLSVSAAEQQQKQAVYLPTKVTLALSENRLRHQAVSDNNLHLQVKLPKHLLIRDKAISWRIYQGKQRIRNLTGNHQTLKLAMGTYVVKLKIGRYQATKQITLQSGQQLRPYFKAELGRLQVSAQHPVTWQVTGPDNFHYRINKSRMIDDIVPAGHYRVKALLPAVIHKQKVSVGNGEHIKQRLSMPLGKVRLIAIRNNQPLLQPVEWEVFRLSNNQRQRMGTYQLNSNRISMPPGQYEAVARHLDKTSKRRFWVQQQTSHNVIVALE